MERLDAATKRDDGDTLAQLEAQVASLADRFAEASPAPDALSKVEENIGKLQELIGDSRRETIEAARDAARSTLSEFAGQIPAYPDEALIQALREDLRTLQTAALTSDRHNHETLEAVHDTLAKVGPAPMRAGDVLIPANRPAAAVDPDRPEPQPLPRAGEVVTLDVTLGPRTDWFTEKGVETLLKQEWLVTAESSRVGMRLSGDEPLERQVHAELPSEGTAIGALQVPHSGQPVLFLADHPLTGGYPVIGVVAHYHLDRAGQIPIGARIRFNSIAGFEPEEIR